MKTLQLLYTGTLVIFLLLALPVRVFAGSGDVFLQELEISEAYQTVADPISRKALTFTRSGLQMNITRNMNIDAYNGTIIMFHGGSWEKGDENTLNYLSVFLAERGFLVATPTYRKTPQAHFPAQIVDGTSAIAFMEEYVTQQNITSLTTIVTGFSAGGHVALISTLAHTQKGGQVDGLLVAGAPTNLISIEEEYIPITPEQDEIRRNRLYAYMGCAQRDAACEHTMKRASISSYDLENFPATLIIHGKYDEAVPLQQATNLKTQLAANSIPSRLLVDEEAGHNSFQLLANNRKTVLNFFHKVAY